MHVRILVVGLGGIGRRHARNLRALDPELRLACCRRPGVASVDEDGLFEDRFSSIGAALSWRPDAAVVATPAALHLEVALALAEQGAHLFIEKPLSHSVDGIDRLLDTCRVRGLVLTVGYNLRFDSRLRAIRDALVRGRIGRLLTISAEAGQFLPEWRRDRDYRESASARRALGGGALLELSHELDYVRWLSGEVATVSARASRVSDLEIDVEDTAEVTLGFVTGAIGHVHVDMIDRAPRRGCRVVGSTGTLQWDALAGQARLAGDAGPWSSLCGESRDDRNASYLEEMRCFLACVKQGGSPAVSGEEGRRVVEIALAARRSAETGQTVRV